MLWQAATTTTTTASTMATASSTFCCRVRRLFFFCFWGFSTRFPPLLSLFFLSIAFSYPFNASRASSVARCTGLPMSSISRTVISRPIKRPLSRSS